MEIKPDWSKAPEWANWWAHHGGGQAFWFEHEPMRNRWGWDHLGKRWEGAGEVPWDLHGWRDSLHNRIQQCPAGHDPVDRPKHYTSHPSGVECIQITRHMGFCLGNAIKYIWRADLKNDTIEDLRKAIWYLEQEITHRERYNEPETT